MKKIISIALIACISITGAIAFTGCNDNTPNVNSPANIDINYLKEGANIKVDKEHEIGYQLDKPKKGDKIAILHTELGDIKLRLFPENAPKSVQNFIDLAESGKYNNIKFYRTLKNSFIEAGDYVNNDGTGGKSAAGGNFDDEFCDRLFNIRGSVAMQNESKKDTNNSIFFINQAKPDKFQGFDSYTQTWKTSYSIICQKIKDGEKDTVANINGLSFFNPTIIPAEVQKMYEKNGGKPEYDGQYNAADIGRTVFAQVYEGMDIVDEIIAKPLDSKTGEPVKPVVIKTVEIATY